MLAALPDDVGEILDDEKTSHVFFCLATNVNNPTAIAQRIRATPPNAIQHLQRLRDLKIATKEVREKGREQRYLVDWNRFRGVCVELFDELDASIKRDDIIRRLGEKLEMGGGVDVKERMLHSSAFRDFLKFYFIKRYEFYLELKKRDRGRLKDLWRFFFPTVLEGIREIENSLLQAYPKVDWRQPQDPKKTELRGILDSWKRAIESAPTMWTHSLRAALTAEELDSYKPSLKYYH